MTRLARLLAPQNRALLGAIMYGALAVALMLWRLW